MKKTILLISGSPEAKNKFAEIVKEIAWVWAINSKDFIRENLKLFYWDGSRNEEINLVISNQLELYNEKFDFEKKYLMEKINRFQADESEVKVHENKTFDKFVLIAHGVSKDLVSFLQEEYGVFKIHLSKREYHSNENLNDYTVLYEDDENFTIEVNRIVEVLTK